MTAAALIFATVLAVNGSRDGAVKLTIEAETRQIDPAKSVFLTVRLVSSRGRTAELPDLRSRLTGFSLAEDFVDPPETAKDGTVTQVANWRLVPEPCAAVYKLRPSAVEVDGGRDSFVVSAVKFDPPPPRATASGAMEIAPERDPEPFDWRRLGRYALYAVGGLVALAVVWLLVRLAARKVKEVRMSPIERAWTELARLLRKELPARGRFKDFYVELTMVVRRYIQRKYGIHAPHLTTEEFFAELAATKTELPGEAAKTLHDFLESADLVKFAGVEATREMAGEATESARGYLRTDDRVGGGRS